MELPGRLQNCNQWGWIVVKFDSNKIAFNFHFYIAPPALIVLRPSKNFGCISSIKTSRISAARDLSPFLIAASEILTLLACSTSCLVSLSFLSIACLARLHARFANLLAAFRHLTQRQPTPSRLQWLSGAFGQIELFVC